MMIEDELIDPTNPLSEPFQELVFDRGKRLKALRSRVPTDPSAAEEFRALLAEQLKAYDQLLQATERFPVGSDDDPAAIFRRAMDREIQKLRDDAEWSQTRGR
jgi:hypothetical protein